MGLRRMLWNYTGSTHDDRTYFTPAERFYHVDHGGTPPSLPPESWRLRLSGRVARPLEITYTDVLARIETYGITRYAKCLQCLRDPLGDDVEKRWYASSGLWGGLPLAVFLEEAGVLWGSTRINYGGRDPSGFFSSIPLESAMGAREGLPVLLVTELNGRPLPHLRGGPVRMLVPDMLGFKSIKWIDWICVTDANIPNGWYERNRGVILPSAHKDPALKTTARIAPVPSVCPEHPMHPRLGHFPACQPLGFRGYAVAGSRGLAGVRFQVREFHPIGPGAVIEDRMAGFEPPGAWGLDVPFPPGVLHFSGETPMRWPLPFGWVYWHAWFGPLSPGKYVFEVWALDAEGHEQPDPDPNEHTGSARREEVVFHVAW